MPISFIHHFKNFANVLVRHFLMKEVTHGVYEDAPGSLPFQRFSKLLGDKTKIEALLIGMTGNATPALRERLGVAVLAPSADLGATPYRIPRRIGPFD